MICDDCKKRRAVSKYGVKYYECAVLQTKDLQPGEPERLPVWGPECSAYTDDPDWQEKVEEGLKKYQEKGGGRSETPEMFLV